MKTLTCDASPTVSNCRGGGSGSGRAYVVRGASGGTWRTATTPTKTSTAISSPTATSARLPVTTTTTTTTTSTPTSSAMGRGRASVRGNAGHTVVSKADNEKSVPSP